MILLIIIEALVTIIAVDFISGCVHWAEDTFCTENTPLVGKWIVRPNDLHHRDGTAFLKNSWLHSSWDLALAGLIVIILARLFDCLTWQVWLLVTVGANANQIHKWSHQPPALVPFPIRLLQRAHILQSARTHLRHHEQAKNDHYCVVTDLVNPVLDHLHFWRFLERVLVPVFGAPRREDLRDRSPLGF